MDNIDDGTEEYTDRIIESKFTYHPPKNDQPGRYVVLRTKAKEFALLIRSLTPFSPEQGEAIKKVEEAMFWANASIARNE